MSTSSVIVILVPNNTRSERNCANEQPAFQRFKGIGSMCYTFVLRVVESDRFNLRDISHFTYIYIFVYSYLFF